MSDNGDNPRLRRIEEHIEVIFKIQRDMQQEHQSLLKAQVVQGDEMQQIKKRTDESFKSLADAQQRMDDALTTVMGTLDGFGKRADEILKAFGERMEVSARTAEERFRRTEELLAESARKTDEQFRRTDERMDASARKTDEAIRALAATVDKIVRPNS